VPVLSEILDIPTLKRLNKNRHISSQKDVSTSILLTFEIQH